MAKEKEADYAEQLVSLDQGDTSGDTRIELDEPSQDEPTEQGTTDEGGQVPEEAEVEQPAEDPNEVYRKLQSEKDKLATENQSFKSQMSALERELATVKNMMNMTVESARMAQQDQPRQQGVPEWYDPLEAMTPGTNSYQYRRKIERRENLEDARQDFQRIKQQEESERQIQEAMEAYPELTREDVIAKVREYSQPGRLRYKMILDLENRDKRESNLVQEAKKEGVETVSRQVAKASKPTIAPTAGQTRPPDKRTAQEKEMDAHFARIDELDRQQRDAATLGIPVAEK
jgi:hypothetical protein